MNNKRFLGLIILIGFGFLGNYFHIPLFFGADLLFGSIFSLVVLALYGVRWGLVCAVAINLYTIVIWGHPYALYVFILEIIFTNLIQKKTDKSLLLSNCFFWLVIGMPAAFIFYKFFLSANTVSTQLIMLKQAGNGIFNALIASVCLMGFAKFSKNHPLRIITLKESLFTLILTLAIIPIFIIMISEVRDKMSWMEENISSELMSLSKNVSQHLNSWFGQHLYAVETLALNAGDIILDNDFKSLQENTFRTKQLFPDFHNMYIADDSATTISFSPPVNAKGESTIGLNFSDRKYYKQLKATHKPVVSKVFMGRGGVFSPIITVSAPILDRGRFLGYALAALDLSKVKKIINQYSKKKSYRIVLTDSQNKLIASTTHTAESLEIYDLKKNSSILKVKDGIYIRQTIADNIPVLMQYKNSFYVFESKLSNYLPWNLIIEYPVEVMQANLFRIYIKYFLVVLILIVISILAAGGISSALSGPLVELADSTSILTKRAKNQTAKGIPLPQSSIAEIHTLIENFKAMSLIIDKSFKSLQANEEKYRRLTENAKDMIYRMSLPDGNYEYVSPASVDLFGYTPEEFYESAILIKKLIHPDWVDYFNKQWARLLTGKMPPSYEYQIIHKSGEEKWLYQRNVLICNDRGQPLAMEGIVTDITDRKQAEKEKNFYHERFFTILESMDATIYVSDIQTHEIIFMNKQMIHDYGGDYTGEKCWKVFRENSAPCPHCKMDRLFDDKGCPAGVQVWQGYNPVLDKWYNNYDRAIKWVDGRFVKLQIATDITKFKLMEDELRQAHKMESIGTMAGGIAHDFNNILGIIIGNAELALDDIPEWNSAQQNIQEIKTASLRAKDIVRQLLSFSRKTEQIQKPIDIVPVIKESLQLIRSSIPSSIEIHKQYPDHCYKILADATQIHQVIINLCTNAGHAMAANGGILEIILKNICLDKELIKKYYTIPPGRYLSMVVKDTGSGIEREIQGKIFDPYFTTKQVGKGTGMGLSVVHGIVKNHNGFIFVNSKIGKGSSFHIFFPKADKGVVQEDEAKPEKLFKGTETILFVDDEKAIVEMSNQVFKKLGYNVVGKTCPIEALKEFEKNPGHFDLVISDMTMPKMTGLELSEKITGIRPDIPVLICTGHRNPPDEKKYSQKGIAGYIMKPVGMSEIAKKIRTVLDK